MAFLATVVGVGEFSGFFAATAVLEGSLDVFTVAVTLGFGGAVFLATSGLGFATAVAFFGVLAFVVVDFFVVVARAVVFFVVRLVAVFLGVSAAEASADVAAAVLLVTLVLF